jgi:hypothetical protein
LVWKSYASLRCKIFSWLAVLGKCLTSDWQPVKTMLALQLHLPPLLAWAWISDSPPCRLLLHPSSLGLGFVVLQPRHRAAATVRRDFPDRLVVHVYSLDGTPTLPCLVFNWHGGLLEGEEPAYFLSESFLNCSCFRPF